MVLCLIMLIDSLEEDQISKTLNETQGLGRKILKTCKCVYETIVEAGVAALIDEKFVLTKPDFVVFVDKTGLNTNQLKD